MEQDELEELFATPTFKCVTCSKTYKTAQEMLSCSLADNKRIKDEAAKKAREEKEREEEARRKRSKVEKLERALNNLY